MDIETRCRHEVVELHRFFQDWFAGRLPDTDDAFAPLVSALAPSFEMVTPDGATRTRDQVLGGVRGGHPGGDGASSADATRFEIRNHRHRHSFGEVAVVTYEEWQTRGGSSQGRVATAVFQAAEAAPNGVIWLHLHETMLPSADVSA